MVLTITKLTKKEITMENLVYYVGRDADGDYVFQEAKNAYP